MFCQFLPDSNICSVAKPTDRPLRRYNTIDKSGRLDNAEVSSHKIEKKLHSFAYFINLSVIIESHESIKLF